MESYPKVYLYRRIVQAKLFMDAHYDKPIDLTHIAIEACFSKYHFIRVFKGIYGKTPHQYLTWVRMEKAQQLLKDGHSVAEVCEAVGFDSISSFTGLFKKTVKTTPSFYAQEQQELKRQIAKRPVSFVPFCFAEQKGWLAKSNFEETAV